MKLYPEGCSARLQQVARGEMLLLLRHKWSTKKCQHGQRGLTRVTRGSKEVWKQPIIHGNKISLRMGWLNMIFWFYKIRTFDLNFGTLKAISAPFFHLLDSRWERHRACGESWGWGCMLETVPQYQRWKYLQNPNLIVLSESYYSEVELLVLLLCHTQDTPI